MISITVFFCDNFGTFDNQKAIDENELKLFISNLEKIRQLNNSDKLLFSFVSQDNMKTIFNKYLLLKENVSENIFMGRQYYENGYFEDGMVVNSKINDDKPSQILSYIESLKTNFNIANVYFADDCEFYHYVISELAYFKITSIIPSQFKGLIELNQLIKNDILSCRDKQKNIYK